MADVEFTTLEKAYPSSSDQQVAVYSASGGAPQRVRLNASPYPANKFPLEVRWPTGNVCFAADEIGAYYRVEPKTLFNPLGTETTSSAGYRSNDYGWYFDGVSLSGVGSCRSVARAHPAS